MNQRRSAGQKTHGYGRLIIAVFIGLAALAATAPARAEAPGKPWLTDWDQALKQAKEQNKAVFVFCSTVTCQPCAVFKKKVLPEAKVQAAMAQWVPVYLDADDATTMVQKLDPEGVFPTFLACTAQGEVFEQMQGMLPPEPFLKVMETWAQDRDQLRAIDQRLAAEAPTPADHKTRGDFFLERGQFTTARAAYGQALQLDGKDPAGVRADLAFLDAMDQLNQGDAKGRQMLLDMEKQFPASPRLADALFMRAIAALDSNDTSQGVGLLREYQKRYPKGRFYEPAGEIQQELASRQTAAVQEATTATTQTR